MQATSEQKAVELPRPGPVGLAARAFLGAASIFGVVELLINWELFRDYNPFVSDFWIITLITLWTLYNDAVRQGLFTMVLRRRWGAGPLVVFVAGGAALGLGGYAISGEIWNPALAGWVYAGDLLVMGVLAIVFPLAVVTRSPGCELDAIRWLVARHRREAFEGHACALGLDRLDQWEANRRKST